VLACAGTAAVYIEATRTPRPPPWCKKFMHASSACPGDDGVAKILRNIAAARCDHDDSRGPFDARITAITPPVVGELSTVMSMSVCLCVSVRERISRTVRPVFTKLFVGAILRPYGSVLFHQFAIRYVLPVLWMTACWNTMAFFASPIRERICDLNIAYAQ